MPNDHSPLPWSTYGAIVYCYRVRPEDADYVIRKRPDVDDDRAKANAEYIVRAANAYPLAEEMARWFGRHESACGCDGECAVHHAPDCELARIIQAARDVGLLG